MTKDRIDFGLLYSGTGLAADSIARFRAGVDARLGVVNKDGGVAGRTIKYTLGDDESTPELNLVAGRDLAEKHSVLGIIQMSLAPTGSADLLEQQGVPTINGQIVEPGMADRSNVFSHARPLAERPASSVLGEFLAAKGGRRAVTVSVDLSTATQTISQLAADSLRAAGVEVVGDLKVQAEQFNPAQFGAQIKATGADSLVAMVPAAFYYGIVAGARAAGVDLKVAIGNPGTYDRGVLTGAQSRAAGVYSFLDYAPFELQTPAHQRFLAAVAEYAPQVSAQAEGSTLMGWISADLFLAGLQAAGPCPTRASLMAGLKGLDRYDADGLLPAPIDLMNGVGNIAPCYDFVQVASDGTSFTPVQPLPRCGHILR